jgi:CDP-diacylglycerol--glycerol-3-phosphate 3-phosphatidyltransferase
MNLPNKISIARICMIPVFVLVFFLDGVLPFNFGLAAIIFALAACTDFIDGHIARSRGLVTNLGKFLDPIADKVLVSTAMLLLLTMKESLFDTISGCSYELYVTTTICTCIILARELIISAFRQIAALNNVVMAADMLGKYKTTFQDVSIFFLIFSADFFGTFGGILFWFGFILFLCATVLTIWSGISYVIKNKQVLKDN